MAGWISAFRVIPWTDLIVAAPAIVGGARRLWKSVRHRDAGPADGEEPRDRLAMVEAQLEELRKELADATQLMTRLAEQNSHLVAAVATLRVRIRLLFIVCALLAAGLMGILIWH